MIWTHFADVAAFRHTMAVRRLTGLPPHHDRLIRPVMDCLLADTLIMTARQR